MTPEEYIATYGANLSDADKRYIRAFGAPQVATGPARRPYTPGLRIADAPGELDAERGRANADARARSERLDREADSY